MPTDPGSFFVPEPTPPPDPKVTVPLTDWKTINFDELKPNSLLILKVKVDDVKQRLAVTQQLSRSFRPVLDIIKQKHIVMIVMSTEESFEALTEAQMNVFGWYKREGRIITPDEYLNRTAIGDG